MSRFSRFAFGFLTGVCSYIYIYIYVYARSCHLSLSKHVQNDAKSFADDDGHEVAATSKPKPLRLKFLDVSDNRLTSLDGACVLAG